MILAACNPNENILVENYVTIFQSPYEAVREADAIIICTEWDEFTTLDYSKVLAFNCITLNYITWLTL
jgi:UDP-glucose 6-dehydrogenase